MVSIPYSRRWFFVWVFVEVLRTLIRICILLNFTPISSIGNNQLCPPYPSCLQGNYNNFMGTSVPIVGDQDTSDCP